ncbi:hypothetical protein NA56DRAFT_81844 [Hyaloscypha hepaticicola]|uniref:Uncharacterized protein n=1 Tax=Hyaloscypha hepaticicola TaxID=2082293 RepID=A0A2J6Q9R1_9HELO|nr:hypothetical protein NA56DRAFT_81844 [Hyaloscypha hepaticicola]
MGELKMDLPIREGASPRKPASPNAKLEQQDIPLHTVHEKSPTMNAVSQPVEAQYLPDAIEIFKLESGGKINIKKEVQEMRHASSHQKRLKEKYPQIDGGSGRETSKLAKLTSLQARRFIFWKRLSAFRTSTVCCSSPQQYEQVLTPSSYRRRRLHYGDLSWMSR